MSLCNDKTIRIGKLCITNEDYYMLIINIFVLTGLIILIYVKNIIKTKKDKNYSFTVKNSFTPLGEGVLEYFYSYSNNVHKSAPIKKKVQGKSNIQEPKVPEKSQNNNEIKCNSCGRTVEVTYQFTLNKLVPNTN